jgi:flagellar motor protein MotB
VRREKPRLPRIDRDVEVKIHEDENQHLWAVSYADFLMALLAFFILFFSMDEPRRDDLLQTLTLQFEKASLTKSAQTERSPNSVPGSLSAEMMSQLKILNVSFIPQGRSLLVNLPDDYFRPGRYRIDSKNRQVMIRLLELVKPYSEHVNIYFEGHSDEEPLARAKTPVLTDNLVLSSLRATSALNFAKGMGFQSDHLFISGMGSGQRKTRTLSLRLEPREVIR